LTQNWTKSVITIWHPGIRRIPRWETPTKVVNRRVTATWHSCEPSTGLTIVANVAITTGPVFWGARGLLAVNLFITLYIRYFSI